MASLFASSRLVAALENLGEHFGVPDVLLGLVAAFAADGPELTTALSAQLAGRHAVGVGVLFGSNVFNIAALLGLGSLVAGHVALHRRVVALETLVALCIAGSAVALVTGGFGPVVAAVVTLAVFAPYVTLSVLPSSRLPGWLAEALKEEGEEVSQAYPAPARGGVAASASTVFVALAVVIVASVAMERAAARGGSALGLPQVVVGGLVLAAVTSLPNAVAAVHLARAGRGAAMLSEAMNSNTINVVGGLVLPALVGGLVLGSARTGAIFAGASYAAMTLLAAVLAFARRGMGRRGAAVLMAAYGAFFVTLVAVA